MVIARPDAAQPCKTAMLPPGALADTRRARYGGVIHDIKDPRMRRTALPLLALLLLGACNTVRGAGEDARSVGRVFSSHPDGPASPH